MGAVSVAKGYDVVKVLTAEAKSRLAAALRGADRRTAGPAKPPPDAPTGAGGR